MKKIIGILISSLILFLPIFSRANGNTNGNPIILKKSIVGKMEHLFTNLGFDINRDLNLLMEVHGLVDYRKSSLGRNRLYKILKKYDTHSYLMSLPGNRLPHVDCKVGKYGELNHDFYTQIASVVPSRNSILTYSLSQFPGKIFTVGSGDIDTENDNCGGSTFGKDDKAAGCTLHMRHYFTTSEFEILSCKK